MRSFIVTLLVLAGATVPAHAVCDAFGITFSSRDGGRRSYVYTPGVYVEGAFPYDRPASVTVDVKGVFWEIGLGDPAVGSGVDNGAWPALELYRGNYTAGWLFTYNPYPSSLSGSWHRQGVDGCITDDRGSDCMSVLLNDRDEDERSYFALLSAQRDEEDGEYHFVQPVGAPITLGETPIPSVVATTDDGPLIIDVAPLDVPTDALYLTAGDCDEGLVTGLRVYQQVSEAGADAPGDRDREAGWQIALGGEALHGAPLASGTAPRISATGCSDGGALYLATTIVVDGVYELPYVSANSAPVDCGPCRVVDADADDWDAGPCTSRADFDCADDDARVFPGAAQVCDGVNNDCIDPGWPSPAGLGEIDDDGDGVTGCDGDPCPLDADDDLDGDGLCSDVDVCPAIFDPEQTDADGDGYGDPCDACPADPDNDRDGDGFCGDVDNCPGAANVDQADADGDGLGDSCDDCPLDPDNDADHDRICGNVDPCPADPYNDGDGDGQCADVDPCPLDRDNDADADGSCANDDNCPVDENPAQLDDDGDGYGDACDPFAHDHTVGEVDGPREVLTADVDGDGDLDVVVAAQNDRRIQWHENLTGDGLEWRLRPIATSLVSPQDVAVADFDGDGSADVVGAGHQAVTVFANVAGDGSTWVERPVSSAFATPGRLAVGDLDGDGDLDICSIAVNEIGPERVQWHENVSGDAGAWTDHEILQDLDVPNAIDVADVDGDGDADVLVGESGFTSGPRLLVWLENLEGDGSQWSQHIVGDGRQYRSLAAVDVDGDGDRDVLAAVGLGPGFQFGGTYWYENDDGVGGGWSERLVATTHEDHRTVTAIDMDGDEDVDAVVATKYDALLVWHENVAGDGSVWKDRPARELGLNYQVGSAGDIDGDGDVDVLAGSNHLGVIWVERIEANRRPLAVPAAASSVECVAAAATPVVLDGRASRDDDGTIVGFEWFEDFATPAERSLGEGQFVAVDLALGLHHVTLKVTDDKGAVDLATLVVEVVDTVPPRIDLAVRPGILWPPDGQMVTVATEVSADERCSDVANLVLVEVASDEPDVDTPGDVSGATRGTPDVSFELRAERADDGDGRTYTVTWQGEDTTGNTASVQAEVEVPFDERDVARRIRLTLDHSQHGTQLSWTSVAGPAEYVVVRGNAQPDMAPLTCLGAGTADTVVPDPDLPAPGDAFVYLVGFRTGSDDFFGRRIPIANPCAGHVRHVRCLKTRCVDPA